MQRDKSILGLASIRHNRGISLEQISEATRIGVHALQAIEEGDFNKLPGGIYNISYIRQYARAIDFNESDLLAFYHAHTASNPANLPVPPPRKSGGVLAWKIFRRTENSSSEAGQ